MPGSCWASGKEEYMQVVIAAPLTESFPDTIYLHELACGCFLTQFLRYYLC